MIKKLSVICILLASILFEHTEVLADAESAFRELESETGGGVSKPPESETETNVEQEAEVDEDKVETKQGFGAIINQIMESISAIPPKPAPAPAPVPAQATASGQAISETSRTLVLDCFSEQNIKNRGSSDSISVKFLDANRRVVQVGASTRSGDKMAEQIQASLPFVTLKLTDSQCHGVKISGARLPAPPNKIIDVTRNIAQIKYIRIEINGENALWLDRVIFEDKLNRGVQWGKNEGKGYCLSTDAADANGSWKNHIGSAGCTPCKEFSIDSGKTNHNCASERVVGLYWICPRAKCNLDKKRQNGQFLMINEDGRLNVQKIEGGTEGIWEAVAGDTPREFYLRNKKTGEFLINKNNSIGLSSYLISGNVLNAIWHKSLVQSGAFLFYHNLVNVENRLLIRTSQNVIEISAPNFDKRAKTAQWRLMQIPDDVPGEIPFLESNYTCTPSLHNYLTFREAGLACGGPDHAYKPKITSACVRHDYCYFTPWDDSGNDAKSYCDLLLTQDTQKLCGLDPICQNIATIALIALREKDAAFSAFDKGQVWAGDHCVVHNKLSVP